MDKSHNKYLELRQQVAEKGYSGNFGIDSMETVERLFNDFLALTQDYQLLKDMQQRVADDLQLSQQQLLPLRKENAKLHRENYKLHMEDVSQNDTIMRINSEHELRMKAMEDEVNKQKGINDVLQKQIMDTEKEAKRIRDAYESLTMQSAGSAESRRNSFISKPLSPAKANGTVTPSSGFSPSASSGLSGSLAQLESEKKKNAELRSKLPPAVENDARVIRALRLQVDDLNMKLETAKLENKNLEASVASREQELRRNIRTISSLEMHISKAPPLTGAASAAHSSSSNSGIGTTPVEVLEAVDIANKRLIDQLNGQVDFLNEQLALKEAQVKDMTALARASDQFKYDIKMKNEQIAALRAEQTKLMTQLRVMHEQLQNIEGSQDYGGVVTNAMDTGHKLVKDDSDTEILTSDAEKLEKIRMNRTNASSGTIENTPDDGAIGKEADTTSVSDKGDKAASKKEVLVLKGEIRALNSKIGWLTEENKVLLRDVQESKERHKAELLELETELEKEIEKNKILSVGIAATDGKLQGYDSLIAEQAEKYNISVTDSSDKQSELVEQNKKLLDELNKCRESHSEARVDIVHLKADIDCLKVEIQSKENEKQLLTNEKLALERRLKAIQSVQHSREARDAINSHSKGTIEERGDLMTSVEDKSNEIVNLNAEIVQLEEQKATLSEALQLQKAANVKFATKVTNQGVEISELQSIIKQHLDQIADLKINLNDMNDQLNQYKMKQDLGIELGSQETSGNSNWEYRYQTLSKQYQQLSNDLVKIHQEKLQLTSDLEVTTADNESLNRNASLFESEMAEAIHQKEIAESKLIDMQALLNAVEMNTKLHAQEQKHLNKSVENASTINKKMETQLKQLQKELADCNSREIQAKHAFDEIVAERDGLADKLNEQYDVYHNQLSNTRAIEDHNVQLKEMLERQEKKCRNIEMDYVSLQRQYAAFELKFSNSQEENANLKRKLHQQNGDLTGAANDIMVMTQENQALTSELSSVTHDKEMILMKVSDLTSNLASMQQSYRALELEKEDILQSYRTVLQEKKKLENDCHLLGMTRQETGMQINELHGKIAELRGELGAQYAADNRNSIEKTSLNKHLETLNESMVRYQRKLDAVEADNRRLMQDNYNIKQSNTMLNERLQLLIKRSTNAIDNNKLLVHKLTGIESERDALRTLISREKQRSVDLESLLHSSRVLHGNNNQSRSLPASASKNTNSNTKSDLDLTADRHENEKDNVIANATSGGSPVQSENIDDGK